MRLIQNRAKQLDELQTGKLLDLVLSSKRAHREFFQRMRRWKEFVEGIQLPKIRPRRDTENQLVVNLTFAFIRALIPTIFFREPTVNAWPTHPQHEGNQEIVETVVNNSIRRIGFKKETKMELEDAAIFGEGWSKIIFNRGGDDNDFGAGGLTEDYTGSTAWHSMELPVWLRIPAYTVTVDKLAKERDLNQARFVAVEYLRPLSELKKDPRYDIPRDFDISKLHPADMSHGTSEEQKPLGMDDFISMGITGDVQRTKDDLVRFWEVWVFQLVDFKLYKQMVVLAEGADKPIRAPVAWEDLVGRRVNGWPLKKIVFNRVPDSMPMSDVGVWHNIQLSLNWAVSKILNLIDVNNQIYLLNPNKLKHPSKANKQLKSGKSVEYVEVNEDDAVVPVPRHPVSPDLYRAVEILVNFAERISGISEARQGAARNIRTATEASIVERGIQIRTDEKVDIVHDHLKDKIETWWSVVRETVGNDPDKAFVLRVAGDTGGFDWVNFTAEDIDWQPEFNIEVNSFRKADQQQELVKWNTLLGIGMQLFPLLGPSLRLDKMYRELAKALEVENLGDLVGSNVEEQIDEMARLVGIAFGVPAEPQAEENHQVRRQIIAFFINSPYWQAISAEAQQAILQLDQQHALFLQQLQEATSQLGRNVGPNPLDQGGDGRQTAATPANEARQATAFEREATRPIGGTGGQLGV